MVYNFRIEFGFEFGFGFDFDLDFDFDFDFDFEFDLECSDSLGFALILDLGVKVELKLVVLIDLAVTQRLINILYITLEAAWWHSRGKVFHISFPRKTILFLSFSVRGFLSLKRVFRLERIDTVFSDLATNIVASRDQSYTTFNTCCSLLYFNLSSPALTCRSSLLMDSMSAPYAHLKP